jgi:hypothetical protein
MPQRLRSLLLAVVAVMLVSLLGLARSSSDPPAEAPKAKPVAAAGPRYWKGNLHTHSFWSDGDDFPEMIADWYKQTGYDFLSLTDHNVLSDGVKWIDVAEKSARPLALKKYRDRFGDAWVEQRTVKDKDKTKDQVRLKPLAEFRSLLEEPGRFLLVPGEEITHNYAKLPVHLNAINLRDAVKPINAPSVAETIQVNQRLVTEAVKKNGWRTIVSLNHPNFGWGVRAEDMLVDELRFFEVYNGHPSVRNYGDDVHAGTDRVWDIILALRLGKLNLPIVYALGTDDAHAYHAFAVGKANPGRGWIMVRAPHLTAEAIVAAMERGDFYVTTGVKLHDVRADREGLTLEIDAEPGVRYKTQFIVTMRDAPSDSKRRLDKKGEPLLVTEEYSPEIGKVVAEMEGEKAAYRFTGKELYVRARVSSTKTHPNPYQKGDQEMAWTQPARPE